MSPHLYMIIPTNIYLFKVNNRNTEKGVKYVQSQQKRHQNDVIDVVPVFLLLI